MGGGGAGDSALGEAVEASPCSDGKHVPICAGDLCIIGDDVTLLLTSELVLCICAGADPTCTGAGTGMGRGTDPPACFGVLSLV